MRRRFVDGTGGHGDGDDTGSDGARSRRRFLAAGGSVATMALAGCTSLLGGPGGGPVTISDFRGSGPLVERRDPPEGTSIRDLPTLSGELTVYMGGGEAGVWLQLFDLLEQFYDDFSVMHQPGSASDRANAIIEENEASAPQADAFLSVDAGTLGAVAEAGATEPLPDEVLSTVPEAYRDDEGRWIGFAGRARAVPFNTETLTASDVPEKVAQFHQTAAFEDQIGWAPSYGAFQSFVTAMRQLRGDEATGDWLSAMLDHGTGTYADEWRVSNRVADGEILVGFANHYYALRVLRSRSEAPIDLTFTSGDAGALVNVSGAQLLRGTEKAELATDFFRHLLSAEAQEFFATRNYAYPMIPGVDPVADLPSIDELNPPDVDLTQLSDVSGTVSLMREVGVL